MKIGIAGSGAVGGYLGAFLKKAGHDVVFLTRGKHLEAMEANGLTIINDNEEFIVDGTFTNNIHSFLDADLIIFSVKSTDTIAMAEKIKSLGNDQTIILTVQNGVDNEEILSEIFGKERILSCATYMSSEVQRPGVIKKSGVVKLFIGALHEESMQACQHICSVLNEANISASINDDILTSKWKKAIWNTTFNPIAALSLANVGEILDDDELRLTAETVCQEVIAVGNKSGISLGDKIFDVVFRQAEFARTHKPSMLQDRLNNKPMEVESLLGYFVKKARELNVETPAMQLLYSHLRLINNKILSENYS